MGEGRGGWGGGGNRGERNGKPLEALQTRSWSLPRGVLKLQENLFHRLHHPTKHLQNGGEKLQGEEIGGD